MHLPIWLLGKVPSEVCDIAVKEFELIEPMDAAMGETGENVSHFHRNTSVRFAEQDNWFGGILYEHVLKANVTNQWDYEISFHENIQYAKYGVNQHYNWHVDNFPLSGKPFERKITAICLLNDPSEFEGGEFQVKLYQEYSAPLEKGSIIAFPSMLEHRVTPVTSGLRISATLWAGGKRCR
jgi:PKHD-type hydroxylase